MKEPKRKNSKRLDCACTQNRELSWLKFNERVLDEAMDESVPLYERLKFVEIFTNNLDEFFMVRVGSLSDMDRTDPKRRDNKSNMTPKEQMAAIFEVCRGLYKKRDKFCVQLERKLAAENITRRKFESLDKKTKREVENIFRTRILPVLSPLIVDLRNPLPANLRSKGIWVAALLKYKKKYKKKSKKQYEQDSTIGLISLPASLPRFWRIRKNRMEYILLEDIIAAFMSRIFPTVTDGAVFAITRNADINPDDEEMLTSAKYREKVILEQTKDALMSRWILPPVRLEIQNKGESPVAERLKEYLEIPKKQIFNSNAPLTMDYVYPLEDDFSEIQRKELCYEPWRPVTKEERFGDASMMEVVRQRDVLLSYPYDDFGILLELVREAVNAPEVSSLKITIYRIGKGHVKLMGYLRDAAEKGKRVTVLLELKARFDEANNMGWVDELQEAGCRILYGFANYKVHAKMCLIKSEHEDGSTSYITHVGTGNFNAKTAALYTDYALLTADEEIGRDAEQFFRNMEEAYDPRSDIYGSYQHLLVAPVGLKPRLLELIRSEQYKAEMGGEGRILLKMNSITDRELIDALVEAGQAGVRIDMIVRGICCLLPGVPGKTENIRIRSIVGRFLEHSRVFVFGTGDESQVFISSADWMTRNTENRVEVACPIYDERLKTQILDMLAIQLRDNQKARLIDPQGNYKKIESDEEPLSAQQYFMYNARKTSIKMP